jgi:serine/threonine-protein kinase
VLDLRDDLSGDPWQTNTLGELKMAEGSPGTVLAGKYRLESLIGQGGMGSVWRAEHLGLSAPVAVKLLHQHAFASNAESLNRFHREARAAAAIRSPHVVQILDHGIDATLGTPFIVMELMEGESLAQRLARVGRIEPVEAAHIFTHVARALSRAHEAGIVHRDLKPDNVFLVRNEDEVVAKVLDFGIAKAQPHGLDVATVTRTGAVMGTAYYMSPEQISGQKSVDLRSDLWALGVMACECLTGSRPFNADTLGGLTLRICIDPIPAPSSFSIVPAGFDSWFGRCVNRDPTQRYQSARDAAEALRRVCVGQVAASHAGWPPAQDSAQVSSAPTDASLAISSGNARASPRARHKGAVATALGAFAFTALAGAVWVSRAPRKHVASDAGLAGAPSVASAQATPNPANSSQASVPAPLVESARPMVPAATASIAMPMPVSRPKKVVPPRSQPSVPLKPATAIKIPAPVRDVIDDRH